MLAEHRERKIQFVLVVDDCSADEEIAVGRASGTRRAQRVKRLDRPDAERRKQCRRDQLEPDAMREQQICLDRQQDADDEQQARRRPIRVQRRRDEQDADADHQQDGNFRRAEPRRSDQEVGLEDVR